MLKNGQQTPVLLGSKIEPRDSTSIKSLVNEPNTPTDMYHPKIKTEYDMTIKKESPTSTEPLKETTKDTSKDTPKETLICKWSHCYREFQQAELLYHHLCQEHVGRKSQKNLQLKCQWDNCTSKTEKRDHMTSHLRVHVPLKPFACSTCSKRFKRPQDLKKHLKIHLSDLGIDAPKKKRGPKVGSKRVNSKSFHKVSYDQVPAIGSASQPRFNHYAPMQASQPVSYEHWVQMEMPHYTPVYSPALAERVQAISAPTLYVQGFENREPVVAATQFFTRLSTNMAYQVPNIQNQHLYVPNYVGRPDNLYLHSTAHSSDNSVKTSSSSSPIETSVPTTHHTDNKRSPLPAIHYVPQSNIPLVHSHVQPHYSANEVRPLPSLSSISMVTPKYVIDQNLPKYNFHKVSYDQVPAIGSASQPRFNHYAPMQASQPVSYEHWVQMEMPHYTPVYSPALAERVQAISAPTLYVQGFENREPVVAATQFFTRLSTNMAYQVPNIQNQHLYVPNYVGRPDNLYLHSTAHSSDNSVKTSSSSSPIETSVPTTHHTDNKRSPLPAIHYVPQSNIPLVHSHVQPHYSANEVRPLPSLSSISMVTPKYVIDQNLPKYNRTYDTFSTNQKSCADEEEEIYDSDVSDDEISDMMNKVNLSDKNANEEEYDSDEEDFIATFKRVNILKDYAICTLLEEEYDTEDEPEPVLQPDVTESKSFDAHLMTFPEILI